MFGTARRDLVHFQRGAGYASGLDPFQGGGNRKRKESSKIKKKNFARDVLQQESDVHSDCSYH